MVNLTNNATNINIGDGSYGFVNKQTAGGNTFISNTPSVTVGNDVVYAYSTDTKGSVNTALANQCATRLAIELPALS